MIASMRENGLEIKKMGEEYTYIVTDQDMMDSGQKTRIMDMGDWLALTALSMKDFG